MIETPGRFHSKATDHVVAGANEILDDELQKKQSVVNAENESFKDAQTELNEAQSEFNSEVREALGTGGTVDERIANAVNTEKDRAEGAEEALDGRIETLEEAVGEGGSVDERIADEGARHYTKDETYNKTELNNLITTPSQEYVSVTATDQTTSIIDVLPATGVADTIYRVGNWDGTQYNDSVFTEYAWNGSAYIELSTKSQIGEVYDISENHADTKYSDLAAALGVDGANIPQSLRKGGMSVKFVQSSDNKYVQFRCMAQDFTTDVTKWQGVDDEPTAGSDNLVKSGGVVKSNPYFIKVNSGNASIEEEKILGVVKGIHVCGVGETDNYCIREISRARNGGYEFILARIEENSRPSDIMTVKIPTENVTENNGATPMVFESMGIRVEVSIDYTQIELGGIINLFNANMHYAINPALIDIQPANNPIKKSITVVANSGHPSANDELYVNIPSGAEYTLFIENVTGELVGTGFEIYANYKDGTRSQVYTGKIDKFICLTASKDIGKFGIYWRAENALTSGTINFCAGCGSDFQTFAKEFNETNETIDTIETKEKDKRSLSFVKAVDGNPDTYEEVMLDTIQDIKLIGSFPQDKMLSVRELSRNRNNKYEIVICKVAADGSITDLCTASVPSSSVTESTPLTQIEFYDTSYGYIQLRANFSLISDGGIINRYGMNTKYVIRFDKITESPFKSKQYSLDNYSDYNTDTTFASQRSFVPCTEFIEHKYKGQVTPEKRYMCIGFDDFRPSDFNTIMPLFDKYGSKASFHHPASTPELTDSEKIYLSNVVSGKHELGNHTWKHYQYPYTEPMFNGQDPDNPDGSQVPFPSNAQFRNDRGDGKNVFGIDLTTSVSSTINYQGPGIDTAWGSLSDAECQTIREWFSIMKDTNSNIITLLDALSNKYLGTTGSSNGSWDNTLGEYTGGIFTGCKTSANHEIWEKILALTNIYYREEFGLNYDIKTWSLPGSKVSSCYFDYNGMKYYDAEHTKLANYLAKFTSSITGKSRSWIDVLRAYGYQITHDTLWPGRYDGAGAHCMMRQFVLNSHGRKKDALPYSSNITKNYQYDTIASAYDTTHKNAKDMYDSTASAAFKNFIEAARKNMANGVIDVETTDSQNTYSMRLFYEGLLKYCKETGVEIVTKSEAFDICFNHSIENGNLLYNKELRNTAKEFMPTANVPTNPDGYTEGCSVEYDSDNTPILSTTADVTYCHYGIPNGDIKYSADVKGNGTITVYAIKNNSNFDFSNLTEIGSVQIDSADSFVAKNISFNIPNNSMQAYEQVFEGYGNKIIGIRIVYSSGLKVKNIKLVKE